MTDVQNRKIRGNIKNLSNTPTEISPVITTPILPKMSSEPSTSPSSWNTSLTVYNPMKGTISNIPQLPKHWIHIHRAAATASVVSGAATFAATTIATNALTYTASSAISLTGCIASDGTRMIAGDIPALAVSAGAAGLSSAVQTVGSTAGTTLSMITSAAVATIVGSSVMMGTMMYDLVQSFRKPTEKLMDMSPIDSLVEKEYDYDFVIYDTPTTIPVKTDTEV